MVDDRKVPAGYKMTELGVIPSSWKLDYIENLCAKNGLVRGPFGGTLKKEFFVEDGYKVYEQKNAIYQDVDIGSYYIDNNKFNELKRFEINPGDFIVSCSGTIGKIYQIPKNFKKGIINQALLKITIDKSKVYDKFFYHYFRWNIFQHQILDNTQGGAMKNLVGMPIFKKVLILLPTFPEQQAIAEVLSDVDNLITSLEKLIDKKQKIKQGTMQELLTGKRRLPGFTEKWTNYELYELLNYEQPTNYIVKTAEYTEKGIPVLTAGKSFILGYTQETKGIFTDYPVIIFDDFTTASKYVTFSFKVKSSAMKILKLKNPKNNLKLIYEIMQMIEFPLTDHQRYWISEYCKLKVKLPKNIEEQQAIAKILSYMDAEIESLEKKLEKYKVIKQGMMQELLTGRIRLV